MTTQDKTRVSFLWFPWEGAEVWRESDVARALVQDHYDVRADARINKYQLFILKDNDPLLGLLANYAINPDIEVDYPGEEVEGWEL